MRRITTLLIVGMMCCFSLAAPPVPLTVTDNGYYVTLLGPDGTPDLVKVSSVTDLRTDVSEPPTSPPSGPPTSEPDPPETGISLDTSEWANTIDDPYGAHRYSTIFETVRDGVLDGNGADGTGSVTSDNLFRVLRDSADLYVTEDWKGFRSKVGNYLNDRYKAGAWTTPEVLADDLDKIRYGLAYSAYPSPRPPDSELVEIVGAVNGIIQGTDPSDEETSI